jgi:hypothetical protein
MWVFSYLILEKIVCVWGYNGLLYALVWVVWSVFGVNHFGGVRFRGAPRPAGLVALIMR